MIRAQLRGAALVLASLISLSCSSGRRVAESMPVPVTSEPVLDASYDWHALIRVPFQTLLKETPVPLHEVLLFHDTQPAAEAEGKDCYAIDGAPPRFVGQPSDDYLLCFAHDRLIRIEAAARLPAQDAPGIFARACALWAKNASPPAQTEPPGAPCEGSDGKVNYNARLTLAPDEDSATLGIVLTASPSP
jgi:hypothetical protein